MNIKKIIKDTLTIKFDKAFGLDIGDRSIEIIELEKVFKFSVSTYGRTELPEGVVENGKILDQNILAEKLKKLLKEAKPKKVSTNKVIVSLPESQVYIECFSVDATLKSKELTRVIVDRLSLSMPISLDKIYWDFVEKPMADKTKKLIMFMGIQKDIASSYVKFCNSIGLEVVSLCIESLSLARVILKSSPKQSLIIDMGAGATNLSFFDSNDMINMSFTVPIAGSQITEMIKSHLKIEVAEAEALKFKFGLKEGKDNNIREIILPTINDLLKETQKAIVYYEETYKQKLDDIYLIGGSALLPGLVEALKNGLKKEVKLAESAYSVNFSSLTMKGNYFPFFANVIGLGMLGASGEFKDLNLIKKIPPAEVNLVNKLNLFKMGYLSQVDTLRAVINNKYFLIVMIILIVVIFAILNQQAQNFGYTSAPIYP